MSTAAQVVAIQSGLIEEFFKPHPSKPRLDYGSYRNTGGQLIVPRSALSELADLSAFGVSEDVQGQSVAPLIVHGLQLGRAYRIQENMTGVVAARARDLPNDTCAIGDIAPPRPNGFAWFDEPLPGFRDDPTNRGYSAISWTAAVASFPGDVSRPITDDDVSGIGLSFLLTFWADLNNKAWASSSGRTAPHTSLFPVTVRSMYAGDRVRGLWQARLADHVEFDIDTPLVLRPERIALALWQLLGETVPAGSRVERDDEYVPRSTTRRAHNLGMEDPAVTTVVLRRESRPTIAPGTGCPHTSRVEIDAYTAWRWIGSKRDGTRRKVRRTIRRHWSNNDESLPVRHRTIVSELRR